jgi:hypothetical protein
VTGCYYNGVDYYSKEFGISKEDIYEASIYCKQLQCQENFKEGDKYCDGCILSTLHEGIDGDAVSEIESNGFKFVVSEDGKSTFLGSMSEYEEETFGVMGWKRASDVMEKYFSE